jgi:DNA-binding MarR family transcriptional regulator
MGETTQVHLGRALAMDSTTLTRTLAIMQRQGWIQKHRGTDRREWRFRLSKSGEALLKRALPRWEAAQSRLGQQLGATQWAELMKISDGLTAALTKEGE